MSDFIHMNHGKDEQYDEVMALLNKSFGFSTEHDKFESLLPKLYKKENHPEHSNIVLDVNGEARAAVGLYYNKIDVCGTELTYGGIGNVAVHPDYRENGYMRFCMAYCIDEMKQNMTDFSCLCGARQRYAHYSYEPGGIVYHFCFCKSNVKHKLGSIISSDCTIKKIEENDKDILDKISEVHENTDTFKAKREKEKLFDILSSWHYSAYAVIKDGEFCGWFVANEEKSSISEIGFTDEKYIEAILISALENSGKDSISIHVPPFEKELCNYLGLYGEYTTIGHLDFYTIFNFEKVIRAFMTLKSTYSPLADGETILYINGEKWPEKLKITVADNKVSVEEVFDEKPDIVLSHAEAMRLLTSLYSEKRSELKPECASWFPLPLYTYSADNV